MTMSLLSKLKERLRRKRKEDIEIQGVYKPKKTEKIKRLFTVGRGIRKAEERSARRIELLMQEAKTRREARKLYNVLKKEGFDVSLSEVESYIKYRQKKKEREKQREMLKERVGTLLERTGAPKEVVTLFKNKKKERDLFEELVSENGRKKRKGKRGKKGKGKGRKSRNKKGRRKKKPQTIMIRLV